ncbi:MAG: hypothetical protein ACOYOT_07090 [Bacteroidales bacterium]
MKTPEYYKKESQELKAKNPLQSWLALGRYYLMTGEDVECIRTYAKAIDIIVKNTNDTCFKAIEAEFEFLAECQANNPVMCFQIKFYLQITLFIISDVENKEQIKQQLESHCIKKDGFKQPVVIIAGGSSNMEQSVYKYQFEMREIFPEFCGTLISGGTTAGIPGMVGELKQKFEDEQNKYKNHTQSYELIAYLPKQLPENAVKSSAYDAFYETDSDCFSALDILSYWCDLVCSGVKLSEVVVIGINGGDIASMEYRIALSLGAKVGIVVDSGRAVTDIIHDENWNIHSNLIEITNVSDIIKKLTL